MMVTAAVFTCSICGEASHEICAYCTKDACSNHHCARCKRCSDCCECEVPLSAEDAVIEEVAVVNHEVVNEAAVSADAITVPEEPPVEARAVSEIADFLTPEEASVFAGPLDAPPARPDPFALGDPPDSPEDPPDSID